MKPHHLSLSLGLLFAFCAVMGVARHENGYFVGWTSMFAFFFLGLAREQYRETK